MTMNGKAVGIANMLGGVSLAGVLGLAVAAGQYKERVDTLVEQQEAQQEILLEQKVIANEQKHMIDDLQELKQFLRLFILEMKMTRPTPDPTE